MPATLFYWSDEEELPKQVLGGLKTSHCSDRGIEASGTVGFIDVWIPFEKTGGNVRIHITAQVEWQYDPDYIKTVLKNNMMTGHASQLASSIKAKAGVSAVIAGGAQKRLTRDEQIMGQASFLSLTGSGTFEPMYCFSIIEARDIGFEKHSWMCSLVCDDTG